MAGALRSLLFSTVFLVFAGGCATLQEIANLRNVQFNIDALSGLEVAGIDVMRVKSYEDLRAVDVVRVGAAVSRNELPVEFVLDIQAENPQENGVQARMVRMDWTLLLEDVETISGVFDDEVVIPAGDTRLFPIAVRLDLIQFFDRNAPDLVELALSLAGENGEAKNVKLRATPTISTAVGQIRYPEPITILSSTIGG
ncbi:MAG: hypothetical protein KJO98_14735 [Rhodothermia bacterium]|nr:hypothetical protein [Rhodothermia bacterium]